MLLKVNPLPERMQLVVESGAKSILIPSENKRDGSGFLSGSTLVWNSSSLTTSFVNFNQLTASVPPILSLRKAAPESW
jgi:hypothetical protein